MLYFTFVIVLQYPVSDKNYCIDCTISTNQCACTLLLQRPTVPIPPPPIISSPTVNLSSNFLNDDNYVVVYL